MWWLLVLLPAAAALNYRCQNNQVLVVQSFGNDTIRMHCQQLDMCGYQQLRCDYDDSQPQCGGLMNFVAHVVQATATSPVEHTCCNLYNPREPHTIPTHVGNDCFIYELPDGSTHPKQPSGHDDTPYTVLKSASEIPEHIDGMSGYRLRLYLLKNKAPPTLLVKGIERRLDGYRVTICRPRCTSYEAVQTEGTQEPPTEWKAISWSSWTSSTWSSWARSVWGNVANGQNRQRVEEIHHTTESKSNPSPDGPPDGPQHLHVHVNASGNNNNVIEPAQPGHINITVHTGQYRGGNNEFDTKSEGSRNFENANVGRGDGGGTDNGGKGGSGRHREGDGDGEDAGDADNTKPNRKQNRHEKVGRGDGEDGNGESGEGEGRGGNRGKDGKGGKGGKNRAGGGDSGGDDADSGAEEGRNGRGDGAGDNLGKDGAKGKGSGKGKGKGGKGGDGGRGKGVGLENGGDGDDDGSGNGKAGNGGDGDDGDGSKASRSKEGSKGIGGGDSDQGGRGGKGKGKGDGSGDNDGKSGTGDGLDKGGPGGKLDRSGGDGKPGSGSGDGGDGGDGGKAGGSDRGSGGAGGDGAGKDNKKGTGDGGDGGDGNGGAGGKAGVSGGKHGGSGGIGKDGVGGNLGGIDGKNGGDGDGAGDKQGGAGGKGGRAGGDGQDGGSGKAGGADGGAKGAAIDGKDGASGEDGAQGGKIRHGPKDGKDGADGGKAGKGAGGKGGRGGDGTDGNDGLSDGDNENAGKDGQKGHGRIQGRQEVTEETPAAGSATTKRTIDNSKSGSTVGGSDGRGTTPNGGASTSNRGEVKWTDEAGAKAGTDVFTTDEFFVSPGSGGSKTTTRPGSGGGGIKGGAAGGARQSLSASGPLAGKSGSKDIDAGKTTESKAAGSSAAKAALARAAASGANQGTSQTPSPTSTPKATTTARATTRASSTTARIRGAANLAVAPPGGGGSGSADAAGGGGGGSADPPPADPPAFVQANPLAAMNAAVKKMNCFPADAVVTTVTGQKRMDQVAVGDFVLVPSAGDVLKYERVEMFYHREPETRAQFVVLFTASKKRLALTPLHLLPFGECQSMKRDLEKADGVDKWLRASQFAHKAAVGDCVMTVTDSGEVVAERIVKVGRQVSEGIYSPMTADGALIVNGVLSSCFSQVESHTVQKVVYDFLTYAYEFFGMSYGRNSVRQGIPSFINYVHELSHVFLPFSKF